MKVNEIATDQAPVCIKDKEHAEDEAPKEVDREGVPMMCKVNIKTLDVYYTDIWSETWLNIC